MEFLSAIRLNHLYSKDQILTEYIGRVDYGYLNYGLKSAARYYFNRDPLDLTRAEQIALLILPKDSRKYDPYKKPKSFRERFETVVSILVKKWDITTLEQSDILFEKLIWNTKHANELPYVVDFLKTEPSISWKMDNITTNFDRELTEQIDTIAKNTLSELSWKNVSEYGIIIAERGAEDSSNPLLRVMIGWSNYSESTAWQVNTTLALRQPGSTIKPFTYVLAFEKLGFTPESTILDLPVAYKTSEDYAYEPKNYSSYYKWEITLRQALSESVNIPAIKLAEQVWVPVLLDFLKWLGITSLTDTADHYGLGLTLGNGEVSLFELLQAYTIFTNNGQYCSFQIFDVGAFPCKEKVDKKYIDMIVSILSDRYAKIGDFPLYSALDFGDRNVAVKTGTSRNFRDNWAIGFTDHYMIGVWTGNKSGENMKGVTWATGAWEIFRRIVYALEQTETQKSPEKLHSNTQGYLTITNPLEGSLYKREPGKDVDKQKIRLHFETNIPYDTSYLLLDEEKIAGDFISLTPGNHTVKVILIRNGAIVEKTENTFIVQ